MSTISEKLTQLNTIKGDIKTAINNKGGEVGNDFSTYATAINNLSTGSGGSGETYMHPDFFEYRTKNNTNYSYLFHSFYFPSEVVDLSDWNTTGVTTLENAFFGSFTNVKKLILSGWDVSKVTNLTYAFGSKTQLEELDLSGWDTSKVYNMRNMFQGCQFLVTINGYLDLSNLTNGFSPTSNANTVKFCRSLETLYLKNIYKNCTMTNSGQWCINLGDTKVKDECLIYIINELPDLINDKGLTATDKIILTLPPTNTLTQEQVQPAIDKGWNVANTTY